MQKNKNKKLPLVSIILNCYNSAKFLKKSISSVIFQNYKNWELIIFDNCSNDNTKSEILKFKKNKKIKYFRSKKLYSLYNARNLAIEKTKGSLITFLDADDWWLKNRLKKQVEFLEQNKQCNIIYSNLYLFNEKKNKISLFSKKKLYNGKITQLLLDNFKMPILTTMIRKKIFSEYSFDKTYNIIGDFDLFVRISLKEEIFSIQDPLAFYRIHDSNMTTKKIDLNIFELEKWFLKNRNKKKFNNYNFLNIKKIIQTLKVKKFCISGNILKVFLEVFKRPVNLSNLKYIFFLILPKNLINRL
jgi:glycosyltransferase involved in cell wall biosynthesis